MDEGMGWVGSIYVINDYVEVNDAVERETLRYIGEVWMKRQISHITKGQYNIRI